MSPACTSGPCASATSGCARPTTAAPVQATVSVTVADASVMKDGLVTLANTQPTVT